MCGLAGELRFDGRPADRAAVEAMSAALRHRGPDDSGSHADGPVALGFRRLSILDLAGGHQPLASEDGRVVLVFNGEIYNHPRLKAELEAAGTRYRTRSDAETILRLYLRHGSSAVERLEGMFAFALWDGRDQSLLLARDRMGIKPLYYSLEGGRLAFASELRALAAGGASRSLDPLGLWDYLNYGYVHAPRTILAGSRKLPPAHLLRWTASGVELRRYWALPGEAGLPAPEPLAMSDGEALPELERLLDAAVRSHLLADVPVGAFLSGGVDSSVVAALMARALPRLETFTVGFRGARRGLDESHWARLAAKHVGSAHHELILGEDALEAVEDLARCLDEPIADSAILPTYLLSRFARERVKVVLTGEGADELFAGYDRYKAAYLSERLESAPAGLQGPLARLARHAGRGPAFARLPIKTPADWAEACRHQSSDSRLRAYVSPAGLAALTPAWRDWVDSLPRLPGLNGALAADLRTVLADCLLMKVDKASMAASLEARVPFLDRALVEFALRLPTGQKIRLLKGKHLLRRLGLTLLPPSLSWRRKHGFLVPWEEWLRSPRSSIIADALASPALRACGLLEQGRMRADLETLRRGGGSDGVDAGLLFRAAVLALWLSRL